MRAFQFTLIMCYNVTNGDALEKTHMAQSLEEYVAQATQAYQPAQTAIQNQLNAVAGNLATSEQQINKNYAQQQAGLNRARNAAAETASMQAAGSGGSFGGAANLANRKYYDQSFVPAQTQLQTNQANELSQARQNSENLRTSLNSQMAQLQAQANQEGLRQYWAELEAERERENQRALAAQQNAAQNAYMQYLMDEMRNNGSQTASNKSDVDFLSWIKNYSNLNDNSKNYWINNIQNIAKQTGVSGSILQNALANRLQNTDAYKQYLNWRNS